MPTVKPNRAAIYTRISQDREGAGLGVERQQSDCVALATKLGWTIVANYSDNDMSAYSGKPRPGYRSLLEALDAGHVDAVIVWHTDRLHRSPRELEEYVDLCERKKIVTQTCKAGELDLATPSGRAVARTLGAWARFEVEHKSERTKRAQQQAAQAGKWLGGAPPLGWNVNADGSATLDRTAARRIRKATGDVLAGVSLGSVVNAWNTDGFTTSTGKRWNYTSLRQVLTRARNAGLIEYNGEIVATSPWPSIVTEDSWRALCSTLANPERRRSQSNRVRWLMAGLALCGKLDCGVPLRSATASSSNGKRRVVYRCPVRGAGHVARAAAAVDDLINRVVIERLSRPDVADLLSAGGDESGVDLPELRSERIALRSRLDEVSAEFADDVTMPVAQLRKITTRISERIADIDSQLAAAARGGALSEIINAPEPGIAWSAAAIERKRAVLREILTATILPLPPGSSVRNFDPEHVRIDWR